MGALSNNRWKEWARQWGLTYHAPRFLSTAREWMAGPYRGYLVKFGWLAERHLEFYALIRFPKVPDGAVIRQRLLDDPALAEIPGWKKIKAAAGPAKPKLIALPVGGRVVVGTSTAVGARPLVVDSSSLLWARPSPWRRPKVEQLQAWIETLLTALAQATPAFDERCEQCGSSVGRRFVMVNGVPQHLCESCQSALVEKGRAAEHDYEQVAANHLTGTLYGAAVAAVGGALWALISYATDRMFALVAIGIAFLVGIAYRFGAKKMDRTGQVIGVALTIGGVLVGDILFYALLVTKQRPEVGFRLEAGWYVFTKLLERSPADIFFSLFCGVIGSLYVVGILARPKFVPKIEQEEETQAAA